MTSFEIIAVRYGTRTTAKSEVYYDFESLGEPDAATVMDYYFWLLRSSRETIVIDTGFSEISGAARHRETIISPKAALTRLGVDPASVRHVILTHAHYDHTGNLDLFPNAEIVMSRTEFEFIAGPYSNRQHLSAPLDRDDNTKIVKLYEGGAVRLVESPHRFRPDVELIELPGHSPGQIGVIVRGVDGPVILASDAVHYYAELEKDRPFAVMSGLLDMYKSFDIIRGLLREPGAVLVPGHDPGVMLRFNPVDALQPDFAVRIQ